MVCLDCRAVIDDCWRWCPECGSQVLDPPTWVGSSRPGQEFIVDWIMDGEPESTGGTGEPTVTTLA